MNSEPADDGGGGTKPLRLAGWGRIDGAAVTWTIAEGRRGRRWREVVTRTEAIEHSLLLETDRDRRFSHLELSVPGALVTLHPEGDGTLHGNRVSLDGTGIRHVVGRPFGAAAAVFVEESPLGRAAVVWALAAELSAPGSRTIPLVSVDAAGRVGEAADVVVERLSERVWRLGGGERFEVDGDGIPVLRVGTIEPLEA